MTLLLFVFLISTPGVLVTFTLPGGGLSWSARFFIGVALSPFVVALSLIALKTIGVEYAVAARLVVVPCFAGLILAARALPRPHGSREEIAAAVCATLVLAGMAAVLWASWIERPLTITYWHALHHTDVTYATTHPGAIPRDPGLAGSLIRYPFLGHYFWGWLGTWLDQPPIVVARWTNSAWLFVTGALLYGFARKLGLRPAFCALAVVLVLSGNSLLATADDALRGSLGQAPRFGDVRYAQFLQKFYSFNVVPFGLGLAAGWMTLCARLLAGPAKRATVLLFALVLTAAGTLYPLLFPVLWIASAGVVAALTTPVLPGAPEIRGREATTLLALFAAASALSAGYLLFCLSGRAAPAAAWELSGVLLKARLAAFSLGPLALLAAPAIARGLRRREPHIAFSLLLLAASTGFYVLIPVAGANEYKTIFLATMAAGVLAAKSLDDSSLPRGAWAYAAVLAIAAPLLWLNSARLGALSVPGFRPRPPELVTDHFSLALPPGDPNADWTEAVRAHTPRETVVLAPEQLIPPSIVTRRDLFVPTGRYWAGYEVRPDTMVIDVRGADPEVYRSRLQSHRALYGPDPALYAGALTEVAKLERPVAIRLGSPSHPLVPWLEGRGIGSRLPLQGGGAVILIEFAEPPRARGAVQ